MPRVFIHFVMFSVLCFWGHPMAPAADPAKPDVVQKPTLGQLLKQLSDVDFLKRELATEALMLREDFDEAQLRKVFAGRPHPEVRNRLVQVAKHQFFLRMASEFPVPPDDRGALGIRLSPDNQSAPTRFVVQAADHPQLPNTAMVIAQTIPGFPAYVHLRPGDQVLQVNGKKLNECLTDVDFIARLVPQKKNQKLKLRVRRDGRMLDVALDMGSYTQLINLTYSVQYGGGRLLGGPDMFSAYPPWEAYLKRLLPEVSDAPKRDKIPDI